MFTDDNKIYYTLRFAAAMCFFGHGAFGIITKQIWCNYFAVFGIGAAMAHTLMPIVGVLDILMGISILLYPTRFVLGWLVVWGFITATLRPMSGEPFAEMIERAGNYGVPLALLLLCGIQEKGITGWFTKLNTVPVNNETHTKITNVLKVVVFLLLLAHGWLNFIEKKSLVSQYAHLGFSNPLLTAQLVGIFEMAAAIIVLYKPIGSILIILLVWKMGTELFYPHWELFEWIERGGSYGAILALFLSMPRVSSRRRGTLSDDSYLLAEN
jgi:hypothetical protein